MSVPRSAAERLACAARPLALDAWRVVEGQHQIATRKLVDSDAEHLVLEAAIDSAKPAPPPSAGHLHYLLTTPFRYPPLRHGSRFGTRFARGIWYGARSVRTALAEVAYYRVVFLEGTRAALPRLELQLTAFVARIRTARGVDLTRAALAASVSQVSSRTSYVASQRLGRSAREVGIGVLLYRSARDPDGGTAVAVLEPKAFASSRPRRFTTWHCVVTRDAVELSRRDFLRRESHRFERQAFLVRGQLPRPAV